MPAPTLDTAVQAMLTALTPYLPAPAGPLPAPTVSVTSLTERLAGLGNVNGTGARGAFPSVVSKGIRVDAVTRFQLWATGPAQADAGVSTLQSSLSNDAGTLWGKGFLKLALEAAPPPEVIPSLPAWRKHADYRVLFEYTYSDTDGADSLIAQIPITIDSVFDEHTTVTDELVRWDNTTAPMLVVRGPITLGALSLLLFVAGAKPGSTVTLTRTFDGAAGPPAVHPTLASFLGAVAGAAPTERNASMTFATFGDFVAASSPDGDPITMGDWNLDNIPDSYDSLRLPLGAGIALTQPTDLFEVAYQLPALDRVAVMYMRATRGG
ncbi:MAG: hypothetical protein JOZ86_16405 [Candidatus Eremiobacteraeota bacterium]|nr:hypothetical protein [Candidatus Eremiobacteraeota bacterium]